jgi:hypothetical protein
VRLNNLSARLITQRWLAENGNVPAPPEMPYQQYAEHLRRAYAPTCRQAAFATRADAVAYVRHVASVVSACRT